MLRDAASMCAPGEEKLLAHVVLDLAVSLQGLADGTVGEKSAFGTFPRDIAEDIEQGKAG